MEEREESLLPTTFAHLQRVCAPSGSAGVSVRAGGAARHHVLLHAAPGTDHMLHRLLDEVLLFTSVRTRCLFCTAACRRLTALLTLACCQKQKSCSAASSPGLSLSAVCVETSSPRYSWSKKPQVSVCVCCAILGNWPPPGGTFETCSQCLSITNTNEATRRAKAAALEPGIVSDTGKFS